MFDLSPLDWITLPAFVLAGFALVMLRFPKASRGFRA